MRKIVSILTILYCSSVYAEAPPSQLEYNGIFIGQHISVLENEFGKPIKVFKGNHDSKYLLYPLKGDPDGYIAFQIMPEQPENIFGIQTTGSKKAQIPPFLGLRLGDSKEKVKRLFGKPSKTQPAAREKTLWLWRNRNYTVLIDRVGRLSSIKLSGTHGFLDRPPEYNALKLLVTALKSKDPDKIIKHIMPDIGLISPNRLNRPTKALRKIVRDKNSRLMRKLVYGKVSVLSELEKLGINHPGAMRIYQTREMGFVYRIKGSKTIHELVFSFFGGEWRLWKVIFR